MKNICNTETLKLSNNIKKASIILYHHFENEVCESLTKAQLHTLEISTSTYVTGDCTIPCHDHLSLGNFVPRSLRNFIPGSWRVEASLKTESH